jgi:hypothetical protein
VTLGVVALGKRRTNTTASAVIFVAMVVRTEGGDLLGERGLCGHFVAASC